MASAEEINGLATEIRSVALQVSNAARSLEGQILQAQMPMYGTAALLQQLRMIQGQVQQAGEKLMNLRPLEASE